MVFEKQGPKKAYAIVNLENGEDKFIFLPEKAWDEAYTADEVKKFLDYMRKNGEL